MNNMAKNWKSMLFYILIPVLLIGAVWYLSSNQSGTEVQYSQVVQMFEEKDVYKRQQLPGESEHGYF